ncbi:unnamed protein product [Cochlearia groenlandica]
MEDSTFTDLMIDTDEYLIDDWESYFITSEEETTKHQNTELSYGSGEFGPERPVKQIKVNNNKKVNTTLSSSSSSLSSGQVISFGSHDPKTKVVETSLNFSNKNSIDDEKLVYKRNYNGEKRVPQEHVLAERKRRQKLTERLIALSALLPGLKKTDKATILEDAIKHLKQLQEQVKKLEKERLETKKMDQSIILVKRSQVCVDDHHESSSFSSTSSPISSSLEEVSILKQTMPMIEARVSDKDLLIRVHCDNKKKGCMIKILTSLEMFCLDIVNSFTLPFGDSTLVITILSKMNNNFSGPVEEVLNNIRLALAE